MSNVAISYENLVDAYSTVLTASTSAGDLTVSNLADPRVGRRWRAVSTTPYVTVDFGADVSIDVVALVFPRDVANPSGTITHTFDADGGTAGAGVAHDSTAISIGSVDGYGYHVYFPGETITARYWQFNIALDAGTYIDVGRAWAGEAWVPFRNIDYGWSEQWSDISVVTQSRRSGAEFVDTRPRQRAFSFGFSSLEQADALLAREMQRLAGVSGQVLCVIDPDSPAKLSILGRASKVNPITQPHAILYSTAISIRESL